MCCMRLIVAPLFGVVCHGRPIANPRLLQCAKKARPGPKPELADLDATNASQQLHASDIEASQLKTELTHNAT